MLTSKMDTLLPSVDPGLASITIYKKEIDFNRIEQFLILSSLHRFKAVSNTAFAVDTDSSHLYLFFGYLTLYDSVEFWRSMLAMSQLSEGLWADHSM